MIFSRCLALAPATGLTSSSRSERLSANATAVLDPVLVAMASTCNSMKITVAAPADWQGAGSNLPQRCEKSLYATDQRNRKILGNLYAIAARSTRGSTQKGPDFRGPFDSLRMSRCA